MGKSSKMGPERDVGSIGGSLSLKGVNSSIFLFLVYGIIVQNKCSGVKQESVHCVHGVSCFTDFVKLVEEIG